MLLDTPNRKTLATFLAVNRGDLQKLVAPINMTVRGYSADDGRSLASVTLRAEPELPALLSLNRGPDNRHQFLVELIWLGEEPVLPAELLQQLEALNEPGTH